MRLGSFFLRLAWVAALILPVARASAQDAPPQVEAGSAPGAPPPSFQGLPAPGAAAFASLQALESELDKSAGTVVADVGTYTVTWGDIADAIRNLPVIAGGLPLPALYQQAALELMEQKALALRGKEAGLTKDPVVERRMRNASDAALATEVLRRSLGPNLTEKALRATYQALIANKPAPEEVEARIIMVPTESEAEALIQRLRNGADFPELAYKYSKDGTAKNGGDLGYARLDMLSPEIGSVIFAMAPGQMTAYPVRTPNGWFIIRVEQRRQPAAPNFEAIRAALEADIIHAGTPLLQREALKAAPVKYYGLAGKKPEKPPAKSP